MTLRKIPQSTWLLALVCLITAGLYVQLFDHTLVWDEHTLTTQRFVTAPSWEHYRESFQQTQRPVALISVALDHLIWRGWPPGYVLDSLLFHLLVIVLFFRLCRHWLSLFPSLAATLIVALHPISAETVSYLLGRPDLLAVLWSLAALLALRRAHTADRPQRSIAWLYLLSLMALASKETAVLLPFLALFALPRAGTQGNASQFRRSLFWLSPLLLLSTLLLLSRATGWGPLSGSPLNTEAGFTNLAMMASVSAKALQLLLLPVSLCPWYEGLIAPPPATVIVVTLYLFTVVTLGVAAWWLRSSTPMVALGIAWLVGTLLLIAARANTIPPPMNPLSIRWLYPAVIGVAFIAGGVLQWLEPHWPRSSRLVMVLSTIALAFLTWQAQVVWQNDLTLFQRGVECNPHSARVTLWYVDVLKKVGYQEQADQLFAQLLNEQPNHPRVISRLIRNAIAVGDYPQAIDHSHQLVAVAPSLLAYRTMADLFVLTGHLGEAIAAYRKALTYNPRDMLAIIGLGSLYESHRRWGEVTDLYKKGLTHHPMAANLWFRLGRVLKQKQNLQESLQAFNKVEQFDKYCPDGYLEQARILEALGHAERAGEALRRYRTAAHQEAVARPLANPLDAPCGSEPKLMYKMPDGVQNLPVSP